MFYFYFIRNVKLNVTKLIWGKVAHANMLNIHSTEVSETIPFETTKKRVREYNYKAENTLYSFI